MKKILTVAAISLGIAAMAQDSTKAESPKPTITGSVDFYYRFNLANPASGKTNNLTSFTNSHNSFELGMASIRADHSFGKASATIDLGFGRRAEEFSYNDGALDANKNGFLTLAAVKQAYLSYAVSDHFKLTAGKWGTHIGYELLDAYLNRNYSMGYMFSYGPFSHTGIKADISLGGKSALMVGIANPSDMVTVTTPPKFAIAQFSTGSKNDKFKAYLNYQGGRYAPASSLSQFDVVLLGTLTGKFNIGYNGTIQTRKIMDVSNSWWGSALYFNYDPCSSFGLTLRGEYFDDKKDVLGLDASFFQATLSGDIKIGNLTIIPEIRMDNASDNSFFEKHDGTPNKGTASFILAGTYHF
jgi:hypothetical protein